MRSANFLDTLADIEEQHTHLPSAIVRADTTVQESIIGNITIRTETSDDVCPDLVGEDPWEEVLLYFPVLAVDSM